MSIRRVDGKSDIVKKKVGFLADVPENIGKMVSSSSSGGSKSS